MLCVMGHVHNEHSTSQEIRLAEAIIISTTITLIITIKCVGLPGWQSYNEARAGP